MTMNIKSILLTAGIALASLYIWNKIAAPMLSTANPNPYVI